MNTDIRKFSDAILTCKLTRRHRWVVVAAQAGVLDGARVWDSELACELGCGITATEWRDDNGNVLTRTKRSYRYTDDWKSLAEYDHDALERELHRRAAAAKENAGGATH